MIANLRFFLINSGYKKILDFEIIEIIRFLIKTFEEFLKMFKNYHRQIQKIFLIKKSFF